METLLGKPTEYKNQYDKTLLTQIPRSLGRKELNLPKELPFTGIDLWNCYEVSWLNKNGKPCVKFLELEVPFNSEYLIESKSLKLYLNSLNNTQFENESLVSDLIQKDLSDTASTAVKIKISTLDEYNQNKISQFSGKSIDDLDVEISDYNVNSELLELSANNEYVEENLFSDLLKSNCLITNQPDWASIQIQYSGAQIDHKSLLKYIISFRNHNEFHEQCVEHIFNDIQTKCAPDTLTVFAKYTRRGGIDINPLRTNQPLENSEIYKARDIRQ
jgi:7-cyano-7-deazaguanine reductase